MKKLLRPYLAVLLMGSLITTTSCGGDDDPAPVVDRETITTAKLTLEPQGKVGTAVTASYEDLDGPGGNAPVIPQMTLKAGVTYNATLTILNKTTSLNSEIIAEANDHQVYYTSTPTSLMTVTVTDKDSQNRPLGLTSTILTGNAGTGTLKVVLKHQPGTKGSATAGETDVDATFNVVVQQ
ncbi:hypothetical protein JAO76_06190 [Pontibacter sp. BT310]|uniref:Type 1 periplasmic binding fold superfamily protein n=1 Tax=Pontibacter populi TaxID=890055 RepID=A0ABS6X9P8_9BACT|nr:MULTISPECIES: hypothetical protein [Pontibacter]MBJ6117770.1 hypothetical protein [Pontibacter sp. BT310]MBR0570196.1 hypothetical protein [Microvirga sp. STS03]MBW3364622.1 hypothetical protein [Pontibacter populi]